MEEPRPILYGVQDYTPMRQALGHRVPDSLLSEEG